MQELQKTIKFLCKSNETEHKKYAYGNEIEMYTERYSKERKGKLQWQARRETSLRTKGKNCCNRGKVRQGKAKNAKGAVTHETEVKVQENT